MYRIGFLAVLFIVFVVADASSSLSKHRILIGEPQNDNTTVPGKGKEGSPVPSPLLPPTVSSSGENGSDTKPVDDPSKEKVESSQPAKTPKPKVDEGPKVGLNNDTKRGEGKDVETEMKDPETAKTSNDDPKPDTDKVKDNPKEDTDKVLKDNPKEKGKEKDNPKEKEKDNPKEKEKEKEKDNPKEKEKEKEKEKDNPKEKEKDNPKEKEKDNPKEKEKDDPKEKEKDNPKEKEKDNPKEKEEKEKDNPKEKEKEKDNPKEKEKDNPKEKKEKEKDNPKEKEKDNPKEKEKEKQESCAGVTKIKTCAVKDVAVACIKSFSSGSKEVAILVQNVGNSTLKATLSAKGTSKQLEIHKHQNGKVNISIDTGKSTNITLNAGTGECKLHIDPPPWAFPSLKTIATPINGAYFLIVAVLTFGGMWACCLIRKRKERTGGGVPYQELEMGLPESVPATAMETAEGWDEGWDDDWDGENAVKTPGAHLGSISVNGLTSRAANKDGWND